MFQGKKNFKFLRTLFMKSDLLQLGPRPSTVVDFWRMVWKENARVIVCLTNISEADTVSFLTAPDNENSII